MGRQILSITADYSISLLTCICFLVFVCGKHHDLKRVTSCFIGIAVSVLVLIFSEIGERTSAGLSHPTVFRILMSVLGYTARPAIAYFFALIPFRNKISKYGVYLAVPVMVSFVVSCTAFFSPIAFSFNESNTFHRGPLGYLPFIISGIYLAILVYFGIIRLRSKEYHETAICSLITFMCLLGVLLESKFDYSGLLPAACIIGEVFYYMYFLINKYSRDTLTDAFLRNRFYHDIDVKNTAKYFILFDINGLKRINDTFGHIAGDKALVAFSESAFACLPSTVPLYRMGGDEFAILYATDSEEKIRMLLERIRAEAEDNGLTYGFSVGYARFTCGKDFNQAYADADAMLYRNKSAYWANKNSGKVRTV